MKKPKSDRAIVSERFARLVVLLLIVTGLLVLIGWYGNLMFLTRFSVNEVPMAPSTAYIVILTAAGLFFYHRPQKSVINRNAVIASAVTVICLSCFLIITSIFNYNSCWEHAFIKLPETHLNIKIGHISIVTALLFVISGFALLFLPSKRKIFKTCGLIIELIVFIFSFILMLGYGFGDPFFYFDIFIPPAFLTSLSFLLISSALIASSDKNTFFFKLILKKSTSAKLMRAFLPTAVSITVIESLIIVRIFPLFNIHPAISVTLLNLFFIAVVIPVVLIISKRLGKSLDSAIENLNESEERFRKISENAPILINSFDEEGRCLFWNRQCNKTFGWTIEEINEHEVAMALFYPDPAVCEEVLRTVTSDPDEFFREWHPVTKDGKVLSIMWANFSLPNGQVFSMGHDITELKKTEEALLENQRRYKKAQAMGHVGNWEYDPVTTIFWASDEAKRIYGLDPELKNFTTEDVENCIPEREKVHKALNDLIKHHKKYDLVFDILTADKGIRKTIHSIAEIDRDAQGMPIKITGVINDITKQKQAEEELTRTKTLLSETEKFGKIGGWRVDLETMNQTWTEETYRIHEVDMDFEPVVSKGINFYAPSSKKIIENAFNHTIETGEPYDLELELITAKGNRIWVHSIGKAQQLDGVTKVVSGSFQDITERKKSEEALKESEEKLNLIINASPIGICTVDPLGNFLTTNTAYENMLGYSKEECRSLSFFDVTHPDDRPGNKELFHSMFSLEKTGSSIKKRFIRKDGSEIDVDVHAIGIMDSEGNIRFGTAFVEDITEKEKAELKIQSLAKFPSENPNPVLRISNSGNVLYFNDAAKMIINSWQTDLNKDIPEKWTKIIEKSAKRGKSLIVEDNIQDRILSFAVSPVKDAGYVNLYARDITERQRAEEALRESEAKLNALFTSMTEMVVLHELVMNASGEAVDYRIIDCNEVFTEVIGINKEEVIGKLASEVYQTDPPPYLDKYAEVGQGGDPHEFTTYYPSLDKHFLISVVSPSPGKFATITSDISDMMQVQETIIAKNKEMENYLYIASHDLRTPLVNIQGFSQRLKKQADSIKSLFTDTVIEPEILHELSNITDENIPKTLAFILSNIDKMDTLINGLLQLSRTGRVDMNIQKIDMNALIAKILQSLDFQIKEARCEIIIENLPECYGDAALLDQLFANIISNSLKYSDSQRALTINIKAKKRFNRVVYTISDTGRGIAQKHLEKIWDVFYRIDPRSGISGEGLGLSLVKRIAEKHKGKVWVESEESKGSDFYIELNNRPFTEV